MELNSFSFLSITDQTISSYIWSI